MLVKLENGMLLDCYHSDNPCWSDNADCVYGYTIFNCDGSFYDGGEFDFDSTQYKNDEEIITGIINFHFDTNYRFIKIIDTDDCEYENLDELLENNVSKCDTVSLLNNTMDGELASHYMEEFGCSYDEIVDEHGFGYEDEEESIFNVVGSDLVAINVPDYLIFKEMLFAFTREEKIAVIDKYTRE